MKRFDLSPDRAHYLAISLGGGRVRLRLRHSSGDRCSPLHEAFLRHLAFHSAGRVFRLEESREELVLGRPPGILQVCLGKGLLLGHIRWTGRSYGVEYQERLSPLELRYLSENGQPWPHQPSRLPSDVRLQTDLHVHLAGALRPVALLRIGRQTGISYPADLLAEAGIRSESGPLVRLADLPERVCARLATEMAIPLDRQITFLELERRYRLRAPIARSPAALLPMLRQIVSDYRRMGVRYAELSFSNIVERANLEMLFRHLPDLERSSGVRLRFLAAMSRHDDYEWDLDYLARLRQLAHCRYLAGADFMGHETNSTCDFARQVRALAAWADRHCPGFVIRIHAGENPAYPGNVREAIACVAGSRVQLRIGHGLYGVDSRTLALLRRCGAIVEFNLNSNFALNNIQDRAAIPLRRYLDAGVQVVLGTDGYGMYQSNLDLEVRAAGLAGLRSADLARIRACEEAYLRRRMALEQAHTADYAAFTVPADRRPSHFTAEVVARKRRRRENTRKRLLARLERLRVPLLGGEELRKVLEGRLCLSVAGSWAHSWKATPRAQRARIRKELSRLLDGLDATRTVLISGGTRHGVEHLVQALGARRGFQRLGTLVWETPPQAVQPGALTQACLVGETLYEKAAGLYQLLRGCNGVCLFIGGGPIVNDEIQVAQNLRLRYFLMAGPRGASTVHARQQPERSFRRAEEVLRALDTFPGWASRESGYWHLGPNPTADIVLTRHAPGTRRLQLLLIRRDLDAPTEPGKWALPGGFQQTHAPRGSLWRAGRESALDACLRELREETGIELGRLARGVEQTGTYEGGGRDPRDTPAAWSRSTVFAFHLPPKLARQTLVGGDDACDAAWFDLRDLPQPLAFDHQRIISDTLRQRARPRRR